MSHYRYLKTHFIYRSEVNVYVFIYDPVDSSLSQRPLQLHKAVHCSSALTHLHLLVQPLSLLHPHFNSSWQLCDASGRVINSGSQTWLALRTQPHSLGHGRGWDRTNALPQQCPAWYAHRFVCRRKASAVGGIPSMSLPFRVKRSLRASFTSLQVLERSYMMIT